MSRQVAQQYVQVVRSLPPPPAGTKAFLELGNEMNGMWKCQCDHSLPDDCMPAALAAAEVAAWTRDSLAALSVIPWLAVAASPMAPIGPHANDCCSGLDTPAAIRRDAIGSALHCPASTPTTDDMRQTDFLRLMVAAVPSAFEHADWLASHAYPAADPCVGSFIVS